MGKRKHVIGSEGSSRVAGQSHVEERGAPGPLCAGCQAKNQGHRQREKRKASGDAIHT